MKYWIQWKLKFGFNDDGKPRIWYNHLDFRTKKEAKDYLWTHEGGYYPEGIYRYRIIKVKK